MNRKGKVAGHTHRAIGWGAISAGGLGAWDGVGGPRCSFNLGEMVGYDGG